MQTNSARQLQVSDVGNHVEPSGAAVAWVKQLFRERLGGNFTLNLVGGRQWTLSCQGRDGVMNLPLMAQFWQLADNAAMPFTSVSLPESEWKVPCGNPLPMPGGEGELEPVGVFQSSESGSVLNYDIPGLAYWMMTRVEERVSNVRDSHGRFPAEESHAFKHGYLERPVVDEWMDILRQACARVWPGCQLKRTSFSMELSHDVDRHSRYFDKTLWGLLRAIAGDVVKRRKFGAIPVGLLAFLGKQGELHKYDIYNTYDWIMDQSEAQGLKSTFHFIAGVSDPGHDALYTMDSQSIRKLFRQIHERGHEIGLHPSYASREDPEVIVAEAANLRRACHLEGIDLGRLKSRMHYLRWSFAALDALVDAGVSCDNTLTYAGHAGFRCGTCFDYQAFDVVAQRALLLRIHPLVAMECSVISKQYMGLGTRDLALQKFLQLKDACRAVDGCFSLLWHNSELYSARKRKLYKAVLNG